MSHERQRMTVIVVGLQRRLDRHEAIKSSLTSIPAADAIFADRIGASVDWRDFTEDDLTDLRGRAFPWRDEKSANSWWNRHLRLGEIACTLSHRNVWEFAKVRLSGPVVILEDDAELLPGFEHCHAVLEQLQSERPEWDLLYLGRERLEADRGRVGNFIVPGYSYCTYGYALSQRGIAKLLASNLQNALIPVDEFLPAMYMEHPRADVRRSFPPVLCAYAVAEDLVLEIPKCCAGTDTEDSPFLYPS